jgi:hypothetical protein
LLQILLLQDWNCPIHQDFLDFLGFHQIQNFLDFHQILDFLMIPDFPDFLMERGIQS